MPFELCEGIHACIANSRLVLLNEPADRYLCLPASLEGALIKALSGSVASNDDPALIERLKHRGLIQQAPYTTAAFAAKAWPERETWCSPTVCGRASLPLVVLAFVVLLLTDWQVAATPLHRQLQGARRRKDRAPATSKPIPDRLLGPFLATRRLIRHHNQCLARSIALTRYLAIFGYYPSLVLGVKMSPFLAHAWVQADNRVLNDDVDTVASYTPILVV